MNFFRAIAATALTGFAALGFASASMAHHLEQQPYVEFESQLLLEALSRTRHRVFRDQGPCNEEPGLMGMANTNRQLLICVDNHKGDHAEMADTLRHETLHLVQYCVSRQNGMTHGLLIDPDNAEEYVEYAHTELHWNIVSYDPAQWNAEAEARVLAHHLDEHHIAQLLVKYCGEGW